MWMIAYGMSLLFDLQSEKLEMEYNGFKLTRYAELISFKLILMQSVTPRLASRYLLF